MPTQPVELVGFPDDDSLHDLFVNLNILADYKAFLPDHLMDVLREQHPNVQLQTIEFLSAGNCDLGGFPSPDNPDHLRVDSLTAPMDLRLRLSTNGSDLHELDISLHVIATNIRESPQVTTDLFIRNHNVLE